MMDVAVFRAKLAADVTSAALQIIEDYLVVGSEGCHKKPEDMRIDTVRKKIVLRPLPSRPSNVTTLQQRRSRVDSESYNSRSGSTDNGDLRSTSVSRGPNMRQIHPRLPSPDEGAIVMQEVQVERSNDNSHGAISGKQSANACSVKDPHTQDPVAQDPITQDPISLDPLSGKVSNDEGSGKSNPVNPSVPSERSQNETGHNSHYYDSAAFETAIYSEAPRNSMFDHNAFSSSGLDQQVSDWKAFSPPWPVSPETLNTDPDHFSLADFSIIGTPNQGTEHLGNAIGCKGNLVEDIIKTARGDATKIKNDFFDELEQLVFSTIRVRHFKHFSTDSRQFNQYLQYLYVGEQPIAEDDFPLFRVLGRGGFGLVSGCKRAYSGKLYAVKVMSKSRVKIKKAEKLCLNERLILATVDSQYIVCLKYAFTTTTDLFLVLDLMMGGDLSYHLRKRTVFSLPESKYYASRILLGIGALHDLGIVYRDLKPENVLMDEHGRTKVSDLGLAKKLTRGLAMGTCGTRGYWAPEMIRRDADGKKHPYGLSVDCFSFGCCIYEFMIGISPFRTDRARHWGEYGGRSRQYNVNNDPVATNASLTARDRSIDLAIIEMEPDYMGLDETTKDLLKRLLRKDGFSRLGAKGGYKEIMRHPWFYDIDFDNLNQSQPPIVPGRDINMFSQAEIGTFNDDKEARKIKLTDLDHKQYEYWSYTSSRAFQEETVEFMLKEEILVSQQYITFFVLCPSQLCVVCDRLMVSYCCV
jgi:beta-adrenergic-receptor kinase